MTKKEINKHLDKILLIPKTDNKIIKWIKKIGHEDCPICGYPLTSSKKIKDIKKQIIEIFNKLDDLKGSEKI